MPCGNTWTGSGRRCSSRHRIPLLCSFCLLALWVGLLLGISAPAAPAADTNLYAGTSSTPVGSLVQQSDDRYAIQIGSTEIGQVRRQSTSRWDVYQGSQQIGAVRSANTRGDRWYISAAGYQVGYIRLERDGRWSIYGSGRKLGYARGDSGGGPISGAALLLLIRPDTPVDLYRAATTAKLGSVSRGGNGEYQVQVNGAPAGTVRSASPSRWTRWDVYRGQSSIGYVVQTGARRWQIYSGRQKAGSVDHASSSTWHITVGGRRLARGEGGGGSGAGVAGAALLLVIDPDTPGEIYEGTTKRGSVSRGNADRYQVQDTSGPAGEVRPRDTARWEVYRADQQVGYVVRYGRRWTIYSGRYQIGSVTLEPNGRWSIYSGYRRAGYAEGGSGAGVAGAALLLVLEPDRPADLYGSTSTLVGSMSPTASGTYRVQSTSAGEVGRVERYSDVRWKVYRGTQQIGYVQRYAVARWTIFLGTRQLGAIEWSSNYQRWNITSSSRRVGYANGGSGAGVAGAALLLLLSQ